MYRRRRLVQAVLSLFISSLMKRKCEIERSDKKPAARQQRAVAHRLRRDVTTSVREYVFYGFFRLKKNMTFYVFLNDLLKNVKSR